MATSSSPSRVWITAAVVILTLWGGYLRLEDLSRESYWMDEGFSVNAIQEIQRTGEARLASGEMYRCPLYCYPSAWVADTLGDSPASYRLVAAVAGVLLIPLFFLIARRMFSTWVALGATSFLAFSSIHIAWSRDARWYTLFELFFWLGLWSFWEWMRAKGTWKRQTFLWGAVTVVATALAILTHALGWLLPLIFVAWFALDRSLIAKRGTKREALIMLGVVVLVGLGALALFSTSLPLYLERFAFYNTLVFYATYLVGTYAILLIAALPGIMLTTGRDKRPVWFLILVFLAYLVPLALFNPIIHYRYLFHLVPVIFIGAAFGLVVLFERIKDRISRGATLVAVLVVFIWSSAGVLSSQVFYPLETDEGIWLPGRTYSAATPEPDWSNAYGYIREHRTEGSIIISSLPVMTKVYLGESGYWLPYSYLGVPSPADEIKDGKESYVGARAIESVEELVSLIETKHGFVVFDRMASAKRVDEALLSYIDTHTTLVFHDRRAPYSEIWVYSF